MKASTEKHATFNDHENMHIPIQRDGHQMQNRRRAAQHIARRPHVAHLRAHVPFVGHQIDGAQRHHQAGNEQIGNRQRHDQIVGHTLQIPFQQNGCDDEHVACGPDDDADDDGRDGWLAWCWRNAMKTDINGRILMRFPHFVLFKLHVPTRRMHFPINNV